MSMPATRPAAAPEIDALIKQVIDGQFGGPAACTLPEVKTVISHHEKAFERVQKYAFTNGFAVVESQVDRKKHCRVFSCVQWRTSRKSIRPDSKSDNTTKVLSNVDE
jgi:hypothetical protein